MSIGVEYHGRTMTTRTATKPDDLAGYNTEQLAALAHKAFILGCLDAVRRSSPRTGTALMDDLMPAHATCRIYHRQKFRQVYGAAFDMTRMNIKVRINE